MSESRELAVIQGEFRDISPVLTPEDAKEAMRRYQAIAEAVTSADDYQTFKDSDGKPHQFRKRSGWKKLGRFFFVSTEVREVRPFHRHNPNICLRVRMPESFKDVADCGCPVYGVHMTVRATDTRSGRYAEDVGICTAGERRVPAGASLHDLSTRALNRGANRATAALLGVSDPSAEEAQAEQGFAREERMALKTAWDEATPDQRNAALLVMGRAGAKGDTARDTYISFLATGDDPAYEEVLRQLRGQNVEFDPDEVPSA